MGIAPLDPRLPLLSFRWVRSSRSKLRRSSGKVRLMIGALILAFVIVVMIPVGFLMSTAFAAGVFGFLLKDNAEKENEGSELLDCNI